MQLFLRWIVIPVEKFIAIFQVPPKKLTYDHVVKSRLYLQNGDILLSRTDWELSNLFIPGDYKHAAVYLDGLVYEAVTSGVRKVTIEEWLLKKDHAAIVRINKPITNLQKGLDFLVAQIGKPYDYDFLQVRHRQAWYCSLYVYQFLCLAAPEFASIFILRSIIGEMTVSPSDYWLAVGKTTHILVLE